MQNVLYALLEAVKESELRAAISAGWELGSGLSAAEAGSSQFKNKLYKVAESMSRDMGLDADVVIGAALLVMALEARQSPLILGQQRTDRQGDAEQ